MLLVRHIAAARACRRFPAALEYVRAGRVHLTGLALLSNRLTEANHVELLDAAAGRSKADIELLIRTRFPRPDVPESIRPVLALAGVGAGCADAEGGAGCACDAGCASHDGSHAGCAGCAASGVVEWRRCLRIGFMWSSR